MSDILKTEEYFQTIVWKTLSWHTYSVNHFWSEKGITVDEKHLYQNDTSTECTKRGMVAEGYVGKLNTYQDF